MYLSKTEDEVKDFGFNFSDSLGDQSLESVEIVCNKEGLTLSHLTIGGFVKVRISGGKFGESYHIQCLATLTDGQVFELRDILMIE